MTKTFARIWLSAISLSTTFILVLLWSASDAKMYYPEGFVSPLGEKVVFIGSSLTEHILPPFETPGGILGDGRSAVSLSMLSISEQFSNQLLADAIAAGAETIFIEINAYAHDYVGLKSTSTEPEILHSLVQWLRWIGARLSLIVKSFPDLKPDELHQNNQVMVGHGGVKSDQSFEAASLRQEDFYRFLNIDPSHADELGGLLSGAREAGVEVFFFSPPRPQSLVSKIGYDEFNDLLSHLNHIANAFDMPLWYALTPWPDNHFLDIQAHANQQGTIRFQKEISQWYQARQ